MATTALQIERPKGNELLIQVPKIDVRQIQLSIVGESPLICHRWSDKATQMMLDKQMKKAKTAKEAKNPEQDFRDSLYLMPDEVSYGFPCVAFKAAAVGACRFADGIKMTEARGAFHVDGELTKIEGTPRMRRDMVKLSMGVADVRFRGEFPEWSTTLTVSYNAAALSPEQIVNLMNLGGFGVGIGEWRPERDGSYGRFRVG